MFCTQCGKEVSDGAAFCSGCGSKLSVPVEVTQAVEASEAVEVAEAAEIAEAPTGLLTDEEASEVEGAASADDAVAGETESVEDVEAGKAAQAEGAEGVTGAHAAKEAAATEAAPAATVPQTVATPMSVGGYTPAKKATKKTTAIILAAVAVVLVGVVGAVVYFNFFAPYPIDETTFPDRAMRSYVSKKLDRDSDGKLSRDEAKNATELNLGETSVDDLTGIELFPNLEKLDVSNCEDLKSIDFSKNTKLAEVYCSGTDIDKIDVTVLPELAKLNISNTEIDSIDVSKCPKLESLKATETGLSDVNLSANTALSELTLDQQVEVEGLEETGVRAQYQLTKAESNGVLGVILPAAQQAPETGSRTVTYAYDESHNLVTETKQNNTEYTKGTDERRYEYGENGLVSKTTSTSSNSSKSSVATFSYNGDNKLVKYTSGSSSSTLVWDGDKLTGINNWKVSYDDKGRANQLKLQSGSSSTTITIEYGDNGKVSKITNASLGGGSTTTTYECEYDAKGNCTEIHGSVQYYPNVQPIAYKAKFEYDGAGNMISATYTSGDKETGKLTYKYDDDGNLVERAIENNTQDLKADAKAKYTSGTTTFTYQREFSKASEPDYFDASEQYLLNTGYQQYTRVLDVAPLEDQPIPVRQMLYSWFNYGYY